MTVSSEEMAVAARLAWEALFTPERLQTMPERDALRLVLESEIEKGFEAPPAARSPVKISIV